MNKEIKLNALSKVYNDMYDYYADKLDELYPRLDDETDIEKIKIIESYIDIYTGLKNDLLNSMIKIRDRLWVRT